MIYSLPPVAEIRFYLCISLFITFNFKLNGINLHMFSIVQPLYHGVVINFLHWNHSFIKILSKIFLFIYMITSHKQFYCLLFKNNHTFSPIIKYFAQVSYTRWNAHVFIIWLPASTLDWCVLIQNIDVSFSFYWYRGYNKSFLCEQISLSLIKQKAGLIFHTGAFIACLTVCSGSCNWDFSSFWRSTEENNW